MFEKLWEFLQPKIVPKLDDLIKDGILHLGIGPHMVTIRRSNVDGRINVHIH